MYDWVVLWEAVELAARWLHVITAIAWIGSSFYFVALDLGLHRDRALATGADGEEWQVHGGGILSHSEIPGRPGADARWTGVVQMGKLCDVALWLCHAGAGLLPGGRPVSGRSRCGRSGTLAGNRHFTCFAGLRLAGL